MGSSVSYLAEIQTPDDKNFPQVVTCEEILRVLLEAFSIVSDPGLEFVCKKRELQCLYKKYQCLFDEYSPLFFQFVKNAFGYQLLTIIGKIQEWSVNLVVYETPTGKWKVLTATPFDNCDGCNKFQFTVVKHRSCDNEWEKYEGRKSIINDMISNCTFDFGPDTLIDSRTKPCITFLEPCDKSKVSCEFWLKVSIRNWRLQDHGKNYKIYIDDCEYQTVFTDEMILVKLHDQCKGWKKITVKLFDECGRYARIKSSIVVRLCQDCCCNKKEKCDSSSSSSSCSSSSSSECCEKKKKKKCCESSSSSSEECCKKKKEKCCDSSSSSSECCKKECDSSSSSSCESSSSSSEKCCKKKKKKKCCKSSSTTCPPEVSKEGKAMYCFQDSFPCPESSSSSEMVVRCGDGCDERQVVCKSRKFKCPKQACGNLTCKA